MNAEQNKARAALANANTSAAAADEKCHQLITQKIFGEEFHQACAISENADMDVVGANFAVHLADTEAKTGPEIRVPGDSYMQYLNELSKKERSAA